MRYALKAAKQKTLLQNPLSMKEGQAVQSN